MSTTIEAPEATDLAWSKARLGVTLTREHKRLVALELARRASLAESDHPTNGQDWQILRSLTAGPDVERTFADLVDAYDDWDACQSDVEEWRHRSDVVDTEPMSSERAFEYVTERLDDAVAALVGA